MVEWFKALNFLRSDRICLRFKSSNCSFHHICIDDTRDKNGTVQCLSMRAYGKNNGSIVYLCMLDFFLKTMLNDNASLKVNHLSPLELAPTPPSFLYALTLDKVILDLDTCS